MASIGRRYTPYNCPKMKNVKCWEIKKILRNKEKCREMQRNAMQRGWLVGDWDRFHLFWNLSHWNPTRTYSVKLPKAYFKKWGGGGGGRREGAVWAAVPVGPGRSSRMQLHLHHSWLHEQSELLWTLEGSERCVEKKSVLFIESQLSDDDPVTNISWGLSIHT